MKKLVVIFTIMFIVSSCSKDAIIHSDTAIHIITSDSSSQIDMKSDQTREILPGSTIYLVGDFLNVRFTGFKRKCRTSYSHNQLSGEKACDRES